MAVPGAHPGGAAAGRPAERDPAAGIAGPPGGGGIAGPPGGGGDHGGSGMAGIVAAWLRATIVAAWSWSGRVRAAVAARASSPAPRSDPPDVLAIPRATTASRSLGTPARSRLGRGVGWLRWA